MATIPIYNPQIPFLGQIPGKMRIGSTLKIRAKLHGYHNRCNIFIQSGAALRPRDDVVFHLAIRGDERAIVRNFFKDQAWGSEERYGGFPIHGTESFEIGITAEPNHFRININNHPFCTFSYRLPIDMAEFISVDGQCSIEYVTSDSSFPTYPTHPPVPAYPPVHAHPPIHVSPGFPVTHYPPAPPPMPMPVHPPPYPGHYPDHATPYSAEKDQKKQTMKIAAGAGVIAGVTAVALSNASRNLRRRKC